MYVAIGLFILLVLIIMSVLLHLIAEDLEIRNEYTLQDLNNKREALGLEPRTIEEFDGDYRAE